MAESVSITTSETSEKSNTQGKDCTLGRFLSETEGWKVVAAAAGWEGTPYQLVGSASVKGVGGDCSGTTCHIYKEAGFPYPYQTSANFANFANKTHRFREINIGGGETMQAGDVLLWPGHMAIYAPFPAGHTKHDSGRCDRKGQSIANNMYTAFNSRTGAPYAPYDIKTFRGDAYKVFRYFILPGESGC